ncbi:MAG: hypothetical protein V3U75_06385 [Methylococcaceae bacterium]
MTEVPVKKPSFTDWLIMRLYNRPEEGVQVCVLTTRGKLLARHYRLYLRVGIHDEAANEWTKVQGLRRYRTEARAKAKADKMNKFFNTTGYSAIREDQI